MSARNTTFSVYENGTIVWKGNDKTKAKNAMNYFAMQSEPDRNGKFPDFELHQHGKGVIDNVHMEYDEPMFYASLQEEPWSE